MGLFGINMKEGPGIDKNAKKKRGFFLYIDIVFRKFLKLMQADFLYFLCALPYLIFCFIVISPTIMACLGFNDLTIQAIGEYSVEETRTLAQILYSIIITMFIFNFFGAGPISASYAYVTRCFTRGEHVWIGSDGWDKFKENFVQSLLLIICDILVFILGFNALAFYRALSVQTSIFVIARGLTMSLMFIYMVMHYYAYQIMVTYKCTFIELIKHSIITALAKLPMTVLLTVITGGIFCLMVRYLSTGNPLVFALLMGLVGLTFTRYPIEFYAARVIEKNIRAERKKETKNRAKITYVED